MFFLDAHLTEEQGPGSIKYFRFSPFLKIGPKLTFTLLYLSFFGGEIKHKVLVLHETG